MDTSRETVYKALEFRRPERLPVSGHGPSSDTMLLMPDWPGRAPRRAEPMNGAVSGRVPMPKTSARSPGILWWIWTT